MTDPVTLAVINGRLEQIADEMDAEWSKVKVVQSPSDAEKYGNPGFYGIQLTGGSETVRGYYEPLRLVGAQTRMILLHSAAEILDKPVTELNTEPGMVVHTPTQTRISYGEISRLGKISDPLPQISKTDLKLAKFHLSLIQYRIN